MTGKAKAKGYNEAFARFFENPTREGLRDILKNNIGELRELDFKETLPELSTLAKHILGIGNSGGGCIVIGIEDGTLEPRGLSIVEDKTKVYDGIKKYLPPALLAHVEIVDFTYEAAEYPKLAGKNFQVLFVGEDKKHLPYISLRAGSGIRANTIYIRRGTSTDEANYDEVQRLINSRLETNYSSSKELDLQEHLQQLKVLFQHIDKSIVISGYLSASINAIADVAKSFQFSSMPNPDYPEEDFERFVLRMIRLKKKRIEQEIDVQHLSTE